MQMLPNRMKRSQQSKWESQTAKITRSRLAPFYWFRSEDGLELWEAPEVEDAWNLCLNYQSHQWKRKKTDDQTLEQAYSHNCIGKRDIIWCRVLPNKLLS